MLRKLLALAIALGVALAALPSSAATPAEQARVISLVNGARAAQGLGPVAANAALTSSGEAYAATMAAANFFSHTGLDGSTMQTRDQAAGYLGWTFLAENIAAGQTTADAVFQAWMNSPGHRANILDPRATEIGIGHAYTASSTYHDYWTMELGARPGAPAATPTTVPTPVPTATPGPKVAPPPPGRYRMALPSTLR